MADNGLVKILLRSVSEFNALRKADPGKAIDLSGARLVGADLSHANLRAADISGSDLTWAILKGVDLREAKLTWCDAYYADFSGADLSGAELTATNFYGAKGLKKADYDRVAQGTRESVAFAD
jgi:uncharacterized protein YjbI with pentapeptide repeats